MYISGSSHVAAKAMVCTTMSAAGGGLGVASASMIMFHHVEPDQVANGVRRREDEKEECRVDETEAGELGTDSRQG